MNWWTPPIRVHVDRYALRNFTFNCTIFTKMKAKYGNIHTLTINLLAPTTVGARINL